MTEINEQTRVQAEPGRAKAILSEIGYRYWLPIAWVALVIIFSFIHPGVFNSAANINFIAIAQAVTLTVALALLVPLVGGEFDLSVGAVVTLSGVACAAFMANYGLPLIVALVLTLLLGGLIGVLNGFLVSKLGVSSLIATLGVAMSIEGIVRAYTGGVPIAVGIDPALTGIVHMRLAGIPMLVVIVAVLAVIVWYGLEHTTPGRNLTATGSNARAARLLGLRTNGYVWVSFIISGMIAALGGILTIVVIGSGTPDAGGMGLLLPALAAVFLGATAFKPGKFNVPGTVVGLLLVATGVNGLTLGSSQNWVQQLFAGGTLVFALAISAAVRRRRGERV